MDNLVFKGTVVRNEEQVGVRKMAYVRFWSRTVAIDNLLSLNLTVVFNFNVFPFPPSKVKLNGIYLSSGETQRIVRFASSSISHYVSHNRNERKLSNLHRF